MSEKWQMKSGKYRYDEVFSITNDNHGVGDTWGGELPRVTTQFNHIDYLLKEICRVNGWRYARDWEVIGDGKIQMVFGLVDKDGNEVEEDIMDAWEDGESKLYNLTVDIEIERLSVTIPTEYELQFFAPDRGR